MKDRLQDNQAMIRIASALAFLSMAVCLVVLNWYKMSNNDIWIHLRTGEWILENGWVPGNDFYSWNATHRPYVAFEWLAGIFFYLVYEAAGVTGLLWSKILTMAAIWILLFDTGRLLGARLSVLAPGCALVVYISSARILVRPHIFSYLFIALFIWIFFNYRQRGRKRLWLYSLLPAQVLWINIHGAWPTGILLMTTFALGEGLIWYRAKKLGLGTDQAVSDADMRVIALMVPAVLAVNIINPYGWRLITFPFEVLAMKIYMAGIYEWKPPYDRAFNRSTMFFFYLVHLVMLTFGFFLANREQKNRRSRNSEFIPFLNNALLGILGLFFLVLAFWWFQPADGGSSWNAPNLKVALYALFGIFSVFTVVNYRTVDFTHAGIFGMLFLLSLRHNRNVTDAAIGTFPIMAAAISLAMTRLGGKTGRLPSPKARKKKSARQIEAPGPSEAEKEGGSFWSYPPDPSSPWTILAGTVFLLAVSAHAAVFGYYYDFRGAGRENGLGVANNMPICGVNFIERENITGNAFTSYPFASPLIHRMYPSVKVNMDSRNGHVYGERIYSDYLRTLRTPALMMEYLATNKIDFFFLSHGDRSAKVWAEVGKTGQWAPIYMDNRGFVMVPRTPENADLISREEFRFITPTTWGQTVVNATTAPSVLAEAERAVANCPEATFGYFYKLRAEAAMRRYEDAIASGETLLSLDPKNAQIYSFVGSMYEAISRKTEAIQMYDKALVINPGLKGARDSLTRLRGF